MFLFSLFFFLKGHEHFQSWYGNFTNYDRFWMHLLKNDMDRSSKKDLFHSSTLASFLHRLYVLIFNSWFYYTVLHQDLFCADFFFFYKLNIGDDCISIVGNSSIIRIKNIACGPGHGIRYKIVFGFCCLEPWVSWRPLLNWSILISVGSLGMGNSWAQVHDVIVDQAFLAHTKNGLRIKTWQVINHLHWLLFLIMNLYVGMICVFLNLPFVLVYQGGRGFASQITFQNVLMENVSHPIIIDQYYCDSLTPCLNQVCSLLLTLTL